ncbi:hypothetical protein FRB90_004547 [Tulasnella sp. 427]|nr:hypothetical protein FRB90_004547 [Tulasnella sp. 427]
MDRLMNALKDHMANEARLLARPTLSIPPNASIFGPLVTVPLSRRIKQEDGDDSTEPSTQDGETDESIISRSEEGEHSSAVSSWTESFAPRKRISRPEARASSNTGDRTSKTPLKKRKVEGSAGRSPQQVPLDDWEDDEDDEMAIGYAERKSLSNAISPSGKPAPVKPRTAKTPSRILNNNAGGTKGSDSRRSPVEITAIKSSGGGCSLISRRFVQTHRELEHAPFVLEQQRLALDSGSRTTPDRDLRLRLYFYEENEDLAFSHFVPHCEDGVASTNRKTFQTPVVIDQLNGQFLANQDMHLSGQIKPVPLEIRPLFVSGPSENRIDLVFFSDGYTSDESEKFFKDALYLAQDMSQNQAFAPLSPLQNYWAAFSPSPESGIGIGGKPRNTTFGLYRDGTELRAVYCSKLDVARATALSLGTQCDYPILLANDPLYGGLGGEFTITTASQVNGALVLRHELGHSIIEVGEEYDGGTEYFGVNSQATAEDVKWGHWLTSFKKGHSSLIPPPTRIERSNMPLQLYPWTYLTDADTPYRAQFYASGSFSWYSILFSVSGAAQKSDLIILLDGRNVEFSPRKDIGRDRWHYKIHSSELALPRNLDSQVHASRGLEQGIHEIEFRLGPTAQSRQVQICSVEILEFGNEEEFNAAPGSISLFPTFSSKNMTTYRPTNDACLMRRVTKPNFCSPCLEELWLQHLKRVDLIDGLRLSCGGPQSERSERPHGSRSRIDGRATIELKLVPLAQFRRPSAKIVTGETLKIEWFKDALPLDQHTNSTSLPVSGSGVYEVRATFSTPQIRKDVTGLTESSRKIAVAGLDIDDCSQAKKAVGARKV